MEERSSGVGTDVALKIGGVSSRDWMNALHRNHYHHAPPVQGGRRTFTLDDLVATRIFGAFLAGGASTYWAGLISDRVLAAIKDAPRIERLPIWRVEIEGKPDVVAQPDQPPGGQIIMELPIGEFRRDCRRALREYVKQERA